MGISDIFYIILRRSKAYRLRKKYDNLREKADTIKDPRRRTSLLKTLDQIEPTLIILEEQPITRMEKKRMQLLISSELEKAKLFLSKDYMPDQQRQQYPRR